MSLPQLTNKQIQQGESDDSSFGGCFDRNNLPHPLSDKYYIVNLDSNRGRGTHWCLLDNRRKNVCMWVDSYGMPPPEEVASAMKLTNKPELAYNDADVQALGSEQCGWWCDYFADELADGHDLRKVVAFAVGHPNPDQYLASLYEKPESGQPFQFNKRHFIQNQLKYGKGIFSFIKNRLHFKPREHATKRFGQFLNAEGNKNIASIEVGQTPVLGPVQSVLNVMSLGAYNKVKKKLNYKDVYHNFLVVTMKDGSRFRVEKNHVVEAKPYNPSKEDKLYQIPVTHDLNLKTFIQNAESKNDKFWNYDPATNNCQVFVKDLISKNSLTPSVIETQNVISPQNGKALIGSLPNSLQKIPRLLTDIAGVGDRIFYGDGIKKTRKRKRGT